ncbi:MAG: hypothetical protein KA282_05260 [Clostridia bacterium]|nr:hypothetical protein [Clostridia bacterium]
MGKALVTFIFTSVLSLVAGDYFTIFAPAILMGTIVFVGSTLYSQTEDLKEQVEALRNELAEQGNKEKDDLEK